MKGRAPAYLVYAALAFCAGTLAVSGQSTHSPVITNLTVSSQGALLEWVGPETNTAYTVQFQDTLPDGIWRIPDSIQPFPIPQTQWLDFPNTNESRFYRVIAVPAAERGKLLSEPQFVGTLSTLELRILFTRAGITNTPQYSVRLYKVVYETVSPLGARTLASGALALPEGVGRPLPLLSYQHGTITQTNTAPSSMDVTGEVSVGIAFATSGYAAAVPDYLGLGDSPGLHPYHHARSEATACVDMLRAVRAFCATNGFPLENRLFLCGYSQGGHATMALLRELETFHTSEFTVTACAAMAGAYDLSGVTTTNFLSGRPQPNPYYFLYLLGAYQEVYHFAPSLADVLAPPYDTTLPPLLNGNASGGQINAAMPADPTLILQPRYLQDFKANPRHPLRLALQDNDLYRWKPASPLRLYHCAADRDVIIANTEVAYAAFLAAGAAQVEFIDPVPSADHGGCALPSLELAKMWFDSLR